MTLSSGSYNSLLANQSSCPQLDHEDLEQLDEFDLEEMDLKWQVAMILMRMKKFYKKTGRKLQFDAKEPVGFDKTKVECYNCHKTSHFARECRTKGNQDSRSRDAWNFGNKDGRRSGKQEDSKALVTIDGEGVDWTSHSEEEEDYALMACNSSGSDTEREQLSDASREIKAYTQGLKKVEAQLVAHQQGQLWYEEKIRFIKIDLDDKTDVLTYHKKLLAEAQKEKEDFKAKVEKWHNSSKNLGKLINTQMSANDKFGPGFVIAGGMHVVPPPMTGNYMPSGPDIEIDYSKFTYEPPELVSEPVINESNVESQPKVWYDAPIIEEYESDSKDEETVKNHFTPSKNPKVDKKELGYGFTTRACFVCGSLNHLIRDCDFHEKRMAKQVELNNMLKRNSSQRERRPIWNNVQRVNHQNQFVPTAVALDVRSYSRTDVTLRITYDNVNKRHSTSHGIDGYISIRDQLMARGFLADSSARVIDVRVMKANDVSLEMVSVLISELSCLFLDYASQNTPICRMAARLIVADSRDRYDLVISHFKGISVRGGR
ncbi:ribonuclease H-like domain-containing protein [Tanacetum coccineum]